MARGSHSEAEAARLPRLDAAAIGALFRALRRPGLLCRHSLDRKLREQIILRVASVNRCAVCSAAHGRAATACGLGDETIRRARRGALDEVADERLRVALRLSELRTRGEETLDPAALREFGRVFDPREQAAIRALVDLFTFNNRFNNTWEGLLPGARRRRERLGI